MKISKEYLESKYVEILKLTNYEQFYIKYWEGLNKLLLKRDKISQDILGEIEAPQWLYYTVLHRLSSAHSYIQSIVYLENKLGPNKEDANITFECHRSYEACLNEYYGAIESLTKLINQLCGLYVNNNGNVKFFINQTPEEYIRIKVQLNDSLPNTNLGIRHSGVHDYKPFIHLDKVTGRFMQLKKYTPRILFSDYTDAIDAAKKSKGENVEEVRVSLIKILDQISTSFNNILCIIRDDLLPIYFTKIDIIYK